MLCRKCSKVTAALLLILGLLFLLADLGVWSFWGINWWSAVLLVAGLCCFGKAACKACK